MWFVVQGILLLATDIRPDFVRHQQLPRRIGKAFLSYSNGLFFVVQGFLTPGTDISPIVPALENIWKDRQINEIMSGLNAEWLVVQGFLTPGTDISPIVPALENIWKARQINEIMSGLNAVWLVVQGFLTPGTDISPIVPALENIWKDSLGQSIYDFNFRSVTSKFNDLVYQYPIRIPERYALVIR
jgi:hypothetical protein